MKNAALLIEPVEGILANLRRLLEKAGWEIATAPTNTCALAAVQARPFAIIVTSEKTSSRDDLALLHQIRKIRPHARIIIVTSESTPSDVISAIREHAFSYFTHPCNDGNLAEIVQEAMDVTAWDDGIELVSATPEWLRMSVRCDLETANRLIQFIREIACQLTEQEQEAVATAFREILLNAIEHGGHFDANQHAEISYLRTRRAVCCRIKDPGHGFSLHDIPHAAVSNPAEDPFRHLEQRDAQGMRPGGYGLLLAREMVDEVIYSEKGNEVILIKYIPLPAKD